MVQDEHTHVVTASDSSRPKKVKRILFSFVLFLLVLIGVELGSWGLYPLLRHQGYSRSGIKQELQVRDTELIQPGAPNREPVFIRNHIIHPYMGFARNPGTRQARTDNTVANESGFAGADPITRRSKQRVIICLLGGSFAAGLHGDSEETLKTSLQAHGLFKGKEIVVVALAVNGYKQPQQLLALNYFLSLGAEYDLVINLDGFNEVALPPSENVRGDVYPFYPRLWKVYASRFLDVAGTMQFAALVEQTEKRRRLRETFSRAPLSWSNLSLIIWKFLDQRLEAEINLKTAAVQTRPRDRGPTSGDRNYERDGPDVPTYPHDEALFDALVDQWARSSFLMKDAATSGGASYFHFLQPNQYVADSKPLSSEEEARAISPNPGAPYRLAVEAGYPLLIAKGKELQTRGLRFTDLTAIFKDNRATLYKDDCCHLNKQGYDLVAASIAAIVAEHYTRPDR